MGGRVQEPQTGTEETAPLPPPLPHATRKMLLGYISSTLRLCQPQDQQSQQRTTRRKNTQDKKGSSTPTDPSAPCPQRPTHLNRCFDCRSRKRALKRRLRYLLRYHMPHARCFLVTSALLCACVNRRTNKANSAQPDARTPRTKKAPVRQRARPHHVPSARRISTAVSTAATAPSPR